MYDIYEHIDPKVAERIELLNLQNQLNVIEALVEILLTHTGPDGHGKAPPPDELALLALHREATQFLLSDSGQYRTSGVEVKTGKRRTFDPPDASEVPTLMRNFFRELQAFWPRADGISAAAFSLWRINWIHPFANGNGRTARAFAYACLCIKAEHLLAGRKLIIDVMRNNAVFYKKYLLALKKADKNTERPNLIPMSQLLQDLADIQLKSRYKAHK